MLHPGQLGAVCPCSLAMQDVSCIVLQYEAMGHGAACSLSLPPSIPEWDLQKRKRRRGVSQHFGAVIAVLEAGTD